MNGVKKRRRGIVLITTLFFMILFFMLSFALYQLSPSDNRTALRDKTMTEAHFGCTAGIRYAKEWISAVSKPDTDPGSANILGDNFPTGGGPVTIGSTVIARTHNDIFSVPNTDPNFNVVALSTLSCPHGRFSGKTGIDFLGFRPDANLTTTDYNQMVTQQINWPCLRSPSPLVIGDYQIYTYIVPAAKTVETATGAAGGGLRSYLITTISYRSGLPVLRARCLLKEQSSADYAYRTNKAGLDSYGNPISWVVSNANSVLFDGPVHTNDVPWLNIASSYWDDALTYFPSDAVTKKHPKRAFMGGGLTFSGTNTSLAPNFDGAGYVGGNYGSTPGDAKRPFNASGVPLASSAQGGQPTPEGGNIVNRYDRMIEGGRQRIRKIPSVPLPADLNILKTAAFGADSVTGLDTSGNITANWGVDLTQKNASLQTTSVTVPQYIKNSSGAVQGTVVRNNAPAKEVGIFVNPVSGGTEAAGGVAIKGDTKTMILEVTDSLGKVVTTGLDSGASAANSSSAAGNPTIRIQSTIDSYDSNSGSLKTTYTASGTAAGTWVPTVNAVYHPTVTGSWVATVNAYTTPAVNSYTTANPGPLHSPAGPGTGDTYNEPTGSGSASGFYTCPHPKPDTVHPTVNAVYHPTVNGYTSGYQAAYTSPTVNGYTSGGGATTYTAAGTVLEPFVYKAQDWMVDVKNVATVIPAAMPMPTVAADIKAWQTGVGTNVATGDSNTHQASKLGDTPLSIDPVTNLPVTGVAQTGITSVYLHIGADTAGTKLSANYSVPTGKIIVYKQSRSDANRVDAFLLDRPSAITPAKQPAGTNGAVFSTGDINGLRGVNMEAKTIGVDYSNGKGIGIVDNLWQYGTVQGEKPPTAYHGLGLVATKMNVQTRESRFLNKSLYIYATIIAGKTGNTGGLDVSNSNTDTLTDWNRVAGSTDTNATNRTLQIFGGLTEQITKARLVGSSSGSRGWNQQMNFDKHLSYRPPPFFPSTNTLVPLAYFQESVLGQ